MDPQLPFTTFTFATSAKHLVLPRVATQWTSCALVTISAWITTVKAKFVQRLSMEQILMQ
jgi:hypothetical protein